MSCVNIYTDGENWTRGDPEVYVLAGQVCGSQIKSSKFNLARVNDTNKLFYILDLNNMYFDDTCSWDTFYSGWESDGSCSGIYAWVSCGKQAIPTIRCYHAPCDFEQIHNSWRDNSDDERHAYEPRVHTNKMLGLWNTHNHDSNYSDSRYAAAKLYKRHWFCL